FLRGLRAGSSVVKGILARSPDPTQTLRPVGGAEIDGAGRAACVPSGPRNDHQSRDQTVIFSWSPGLYCSPVAIALTSPMAWATVLDGVSQYSALATSTRRRASSGS